MASWLHAVRAWFNQTAPSFTPCGEIRGLSFFFVVSNPAATTLRERKQKYRMPKKKRGVEQRVKGNVKVCCEQVVKHNICLHVCVCILCVFVNLIVEGC